MSEEIKGSATETQNVGAAEVKTYTEEDVQALLQQEGDRRVSQALKKQKKEMETQLAEAEKLRNMDEAQKKEYEYTQRLQQLEQKERDFTLAQNKLEDTKIMANRGLPVDFVDYIVAEEAETMMDNITRFERAFKGAVADAVAKKISTPSPQSASVQQTGLTKEAFKKLNISQQSELYRTNPELYKQLTK